MLSIKSLLSYASSTVHETIIKIDEVFDNYYKILLKGVLAGRVDLVLQALEHSVNANARFF